ncbi:MAG TPA: DUF5723 family protein [Paludibacteraceae bacterium]|nr:DUF5723 family protein [Paludibacteraceae bacterium]
MKRNIFLLVIGVLSLVSSLFTCLSAQQLNTLYFLENSPVRNYFNPAFQPLSGFYLGFPVLGYTFFELGNNSLTLKDVVYNKNGETILFLNPAGDKNKFYKSLSNKTWLNTDIHLNLLNFGFRSGDAYFSLGITEKVDGSLSLPKDMFKLLLYGTPELENNIFNFKDLGGSVSAYTEIALGYSKILNDQWSVGGKVKFLSGNANTSFTNERLTLNANTDQWLLNGKGSLKISSPAQVTIGEKLDSIEFIKPSSTSDWLKPSGMGAGFDIGFTYKPIQQLTVSAALTDIGFINWKSNIKKVGYDMNYTFDGLVKINNLDSVDMDAFLDTLSNAFKDSYTTQQATSSYTTFTPTKLNIGAEYTFLDNKMSVGLLSRTIFRKNIDEEITTSFNLRPVNWFNLALSYSFLKGKMSNIGAALGLRTGFIYWNLSADYISLNNAQLKLNEIDSSLPSTTIPVPYNSKGINLGLSINFVFGNATDKDKDGVKDSKDKCPDTPKAARKKVDLNGCPLDTDQDSIPDYLDQCPDTPLAARGFVDSKGCLLDSDNDSIPDYLDKCPDTPLEVTVDSLGCPLDMDNDSIPDYLDQCPDTPQGARGFVDSHGCLLDTDNDSVPDYLDKCPDTPAEVIGKVDEKGCPKDTDKDGVPDYLDQCPDTPVEAAGTIDEKGCLRDTDGDGVPDYKDSCRDLPGDSTNNGCPEIKKEVMNLVQVMALAKEASHKIQFESGKATLKPSSYPVLDQIAKILIENPTYKIEVQGHTDNVGKPEKNLELSEKRALAVKEYLVSKGVEESRISTKGYGDTVPIASNSTATGRAQNRRVELIISL